MSTARKVRVAVELTGQAVFAYGAYLFAPWLGYVVLGGFLLLDSYGMSQEIDAQERKQ